MIFDLAIDAQVHQRSFRPLGIGVRQPGGEGRRKLRFSVDVPGQGWEQRKNSRDPDTSIASKDEASFEAASRRARFELHFGRKNEMAQKTPLANEPLREQEATTAIDAKV